MNLFRLLNGRHINNNPVRVVLIGAGKFGTMFLSQANRTPGMQVLGIADLQPDRPRAACIETGWAPEQLDAASVDDAAKTGRTFVTDDAASLISHPATEVVIDATGHPPTGIRSAISAIENGKHIVMVNVEADVLAGPLLAKKAADAGVVYSMAYGDQPALIAEQVDWARTLGLTVTCAGKGTRFQPEFHRSTPDTVWDHYGITAERAAASGMNPQMFNSFLDGTKSAIEMAAVANAYDLHPQPSGLHFPPSAVEQLSTVLRPRNIGGVLDHDNTVEVVASEFRDGSPVPHDLRWGTYVTFRGDTEYVRRCFADYGVLTDDSGDYAALWRPYHLIGLELGVSVASAAIRQEATGFATGFRGDVAATAKRALKKGEMLDGEGGFTVYGRLTRAENSLDGGYLPLGLAHGLKLKRDLPEDAILTYDDVELDPTDPTLQIRQQMEAMFRG